MIASCLLRDAELLAVLAETEAEGGRDIQELQHAASLLCRDQAQNEPVRRDFFVCSRV